MFTFAALTGPQAGLAAAALPKSILVPVGVIGLIAFTAMHLGVIAHEGAHVLAGRSVGRRVGGVELNSDATGKTKTLGPVSGLGVIFTAFAGYLGPSFFGLGAASLIAMGYTGAVLVLALLLLVVMLFLVRNFFGVISVLLNGVLLVVFLGYASAKLQSIAAYGLSWLLLFSGVGHVLVDGSTAGDAVSLRRMTHIPRVVWSLLWLGLTVAALAAGARMLT